MWCVRVALLLLCMAPLAGAQQPSPDEATFYGHVDCGGPTYGISVVAESAGTNCGTGTPGTSITWSLPEDPPLTVDLVLEDGGEVPMTVWVGSNTHGGDVDITSTVYTGSQVVAAATGSATFAGAAGMTYIEVPMTGTVQTTQVTEPLRWEVTASGVFSSIYMRFEDGRWSSFTLPIVAVVGGAGDSDDPVTPVYENLSTAPDLDLSFANESALHVYNWTQTEPLAAMAYNVSGTGNATVTLVVGNNTVAAAQSLVGNGTVDLREAAPGNWSLTLDVQSFNGTIALSFLPMEGEGGPDDDNETQGPGGNETEDGGGGSNGVPAIALPFVAAALALAAARRRG